MHIDIGWRLAAGCYLADKIVCSVNIRYNTHTCLIYQE